MNGQRDNQIITIDDNKEIGARASYEPSRHIDRTGYQDDASNKGSDLKDVFAVIFRRKAIILFITLLLTAIAYIYSLSLTPIYRATASIKIDVQGNKLAQYDDVFKEKAADANFQTTQYDILQSRALAKRVIEKLKLDEATLNGGGQVSVVSSYIKRVKGFISRTVIQPILGDETKVVASVDPKTSSAGSAATTKQRALPLELSFLSNLSLLPSKTSNILKVNYDSYDAELAAKSVNTLTEEFINMSRQDRSDSNTAAKGYISEQLEKAQRKVVESEKRLTEYARKNGIINIDGKHSFIADSLKRLDAEYANAQQQMLTAKSEYQQRSKIARQMSVMNSRAIRMLKNEKTKLQATYNKKLEVYKPAFPEMVQLREEIARVERQIKAETQTINSTSTDNLKTKYLAAKERVAMLASQRAQKKNELLGERDKNVAYAALQREAEADRKHYNTLSKTQKETDIADGVVSDNISIVDPAFVPITAYSPNTKKNVAVGALFGLMLGLAVAFIRDRLDVRIRSVSNLEDLVDLPVLGIFPFVKGKNKKKNRDSDGAILLTANHQSAEYEAVRSLVTNLRYTDAKGLPTIMHVTSASPAEGKSNVAINMAAILAENKLKILLIDADLRKPRIDSYLGVKTSQGLAEYLLDRCEIDDVIIASPQEHLSLITAGMPSPSPAKLLAEDTLMDLLDYAREKYDHIIIDSPPVLGLADALILSNRADITLFVVASHETKSPNLLDALKRLRLGYGNVVGFVLTKAKSSKSDLYSHESYYGYQRNDVVATGTGKPKW